MMATMIGTAKKDNLSGQFQFFLLFPLLQICAPNPAK